MVRLGQMVGPDDHARLLPLKHTVHVQVADCSQARGTRAHDVSMMRYWRAAGLPKSGTGSISPEAEISVFRISVAASRKRRDRHVWYAGGRGSTVMTIAGSNANFTVVRSQRGQWEQKLCRARPSGYLEGETCRLIASTSGRPKGGASPGARSSPPAVRSSSSARRPWPAAARSRGRARRRAGSSTTLRPRQGRPPASHSARRPSPPTRVKAAQVLAPQQAEHRFMLAAGRHPPPRLGRRPRSRVLALQQPHAFPDVLVHQPPPCSPLPAKRCLSELYGPGT